MDFLFEIHIFALICEVLIILALIHMVNQKRSPTSMIAWLLAMLLIPYIAVPVYFLIGSRKRRKNKRTKSHVVLPSLEDNHYRHTHSISTLLVNNGIRRTSENNSFKLISNGIEAYEKMMTEFQSATHSIYISTYVFKFDSTTEKLITLLEEKASAGIEVRLLIDCIGSWQLYYKQQHIFDQLKNAGAKVEFFMPLFQMPFRNYVNLRNHRKIYLIDQCTVFTGGMNLSDEYLGPENTTARWEDLLFMIQGQAVCHFYNLFVLDWRYAAKEKLPLMHVTQKHYGNARLQVVPSGPDVPNDALYESLLNAIYTAEERVWIVTPYFIPSEAMMKALLIAHRKNVDVQLITPKKSNHLIADLARSGYMRTLYEAGIKIAFFEGEMLHAKAIIFDNTACMLGSVNIDNRSLFLNYEVATYAYSPEIISEVHEWMLGLLQRSSYKMEERTRIRKFGENLMKITAPLL